MEGGSRGCRWWGRGEEVGVGGEGGGREGRVGVCGGDKGGEHAWYRLPKSGDMYILILGKERKEEK